MVRIQRTFIGRLVCLLILVIAALSITGCSSDRKSKSDLSSTTVASDEAEGQHVSLPGAQQQEPDIAGFRNYLEQGDLNAIVRRGTLRLLAPRSLSLAEESLPRDGLPTSEWRALAEKFAAKHGLEPQWIYVDSFADLIPALNEGRGDIIAINFSRTPARAAQVAFTRPLEYVQELLITRRDVNPDGGELPVAVREGSAFASTLAKQSTVDNSFTPVFLDEPVDNQALLAGVASGAYQATVIDSNLAEVLLPSYPELQSRELLDSRRAIAWAVRRDAQRLERALNEYFTEEHLVAVQRRSRTLRDWAQIRESRTLRVLTRNHPASYFMWRGELMGFDYELLRRFAHDNGLRLSMVVPGPDVDLAEALAAGMGDVIAASLTVTEERRQQGLVFTRPYMQVTEQLIGASPAPGTMPVAEQVQGQQVAVNPLSSYYTSLRLLAESETAQVDVIPVPGASTERLIDDVVAGKYNYTVADSHLVAIEKTYRDDFTVLGDLTGERDIAWAVRKDQPELLAQLNGFLNKYDRGLFFNVTYNRYFKEDKRMRSRQQERLRSTDQLSPYDTLVRKYALPADRDWRMVVSQMYQESRFNPKAKSFAGARGLMQVLPRTARQLGVSDLFEPENGIRAGITYLGWLEARFPRTLPFDQRIYFTLAAYNAGHGHVRDARRLARKLGKDPNRWFDHVEEAMLLLAQPEYYRQAQFGYVRGREPVNYVREIRDRYFGYLAVARTERAGATVN